MTFVPRSRITPARLEHDAQGTPWSAAYGDVYHAAAGAQGQAAHVFLGGNGLPERWRGAERFVIAETGFGLGSNFLATWDAWQADAQRPSRLHYIAFEQHPFTADDLRRHHQNVGGWAQRATALAAVWPPLTAGLHRLWLADGRIALTLCLGDANDWVGEMTARADAFFLDGFAPRSNPALWSPALLCALAARAAPGATCATWCVARAVRDALAAAGFRCVRRTGFAGKRAMLAGVFTGAAPCPAAAPRRALVIGAGIAGATLADALTRHDIAATVLESAPSVASGASGNPVALVRPLLHAAPTVASELALAAYSLALSAYAPEARPGVLQLASDPGDFAREAERLHTQNWPSGLATLVAPDAAADIAGAKVRAGGVWFARAFALAPPEAVARLLRHADVRLGQTVATLLRTATGWQATDADKAPLGEAPIVIIANAMAALRLLPQPLPMTAVRGQVSLVPQPLWRTVPRVGIAGDGFISALPGGDVCIGATFQRGDHDPRMRAADHAHNLMKAQRLLPQALPEIASDRLAGRVGWRACTPDRLPYAGRIAEGVFVLAGLGARGMLWAPLLAEQLAAEIADAPWPMARSLWARLAPGR